MRLLEGVPCPLAGRKPGEIDYLVVRENTEGEYTNLGGVMFPGTEREFVIQESVFRAWARKGFSSMRSNWRGRAPAST